MNYGIFVLIGIVIILGSLFLAILLFKTSKFIKNKRLSRFFERIADFLESFDPISLP